MKKLEAEKLVNDTFNQAYSEDRFRRFINELFHEYEKPEDKTYAGQYIWDAFKDGIVSYKRLCKFTDPEGMEVDVLAVKVLSRRTLENARTMQRNFIARYLNGGRGGKLKDAALVAFYSDECEDWRFSLVRMDYVLDEEKQKVRKELTPARRFSFLVGKNEMTHTARRQLMPALQSETETTLSELEAAFNIETVTKEFFEKYKALYVSLKDALDQHLKKDKKANTEFEGKTIKVEDFAKRLLGQIVFLYFLQKKGWLGVARGQQWGLGPKDFLQKLYRKELVAYDNFFNDVLEHLFYDALATERHTQDHFFPALNCKIPFLNGGLFEPFKGYAWDDTDILLDNAIFKEIFDVFDLYNFTVREDEPLDKEVAVDPEMLGKVFENLIPENERKGSGTYYTPREIVHYMCQESLINYLDAKLNIESRPIVEKGQQSLIPDMSKTDLLTNFEDIYAPVVPREDIAEFIYHGDIAQEHDATAELKSQQADYKGKYQHKVPESVRKQAQVIDDALASVKICDPAIGSGAFPVGVMNEIVRARGALNAYLGDEGRTPYDFKRHAIQESIYGVDIEPSAVDIAKLRLWLSLVVDEDDFGNIKPLPNLEYKIRSGDSLLGIATKGDLIRSQQFGEVERLKEEYFSVTSPSRKIEIKNRVEKIISDLTSVHTKKGGLQENSRFDYRVFFSEVFRENDGFDIIIANPPYVKIQSIDEAVATIYKNEYMTAKGKFDLYLLFVERGLSLLNRKGYACFIHPHRFLTTDYGKHFKSFIDSSRSLKLAVMFGVEQIFNTATTYTGIFGYGFNCTEILYKKPNSNNLHNSPTTTAKFAKDGSHWVIINSDPQAAKLLGKLSSGEKLSDIVEGVFQGIVTVGDDIFVLEKIREGSPTTTICKSKVLNAEVEIENALLRPLLKGEHIRRYKSPVSDLLVFFPHVDRDSKTVPLEEAELMQSYPLGYKYILNFRDDLTKKKIKYKTNPKYWYSLHRSRQNEIFKEAKIITPQLQNYPNFTIDKDGYWYPDAGGYMITLKNKKELLTPLLGILNSSLLWFFIKHTSNPYNNNYYYFKSDYLNPFGLPARNSKLEAEIGKIVDIMLSKYNEAEQASSEIRVLEDKLNKLVYKLYELTPDEIALVEQSAK